MYSEMLAKLIPRSCGPMFYSLVVKQIWAEKRKIIPTLRFHGDPLFLCPADFYFENKFEKSFRGKTLQYKPPGTFWVEREASFICF